MSRTLFRGGARFDGDAVGRSGQTVVVEGDRIVAVCDDAAVEIRGGDRLVDTTGATRMPGMVQAHRHGLPERRLPHSKVS